MSRISPLKLSADVFFHHLFSSHQRPFLASYKLTYRCNLRCRQCTFSNMPGPELNYKAVCNVLDRLYDRGDRIVIFEGGEPLLWRDNDYHFNDIARYARQKFHCVGVTTNGTLPLEIDTEIAWVSLDGFEATHNHLRQSNIFAQVLEHIRRSSHPRLYAHITVNAENYGEVPQLVRYLSEFVKGISVQFYYPYGTDDQLFLPWPERRALLETLIRLKRSGYPLLNSTASLRALQENRWRCLPWLIDNANPDGSITQGCYLQGRAEIDCSKCGFSPHTEISLAFRGHPGAIRAGMRIFAS